LPKINGDLPGAHACSPSLSPPPQQQKKRFAGMCRKQKQEKSKAHLSPFRRFSPYPEQQEAVMHE